MSLNEIEKLAINDFCRYLRKHPSLFKEHNLQQLQIDHSCKKQNELIKSEPSPQDNQEESPKPIVKNKSSKKKKQKKQKNISNSCNEDEEKKEEISK